MQDIYKKAKPKDDRSVDEIMQNIKRMGDCLIASFGYKSWKDIPKLETKKTDEKQLPKLWTVVY